MIAFTVFITGTVGCIVLAVVNSLSSRNRRLTRVVDNGREPGDGRGDATATEKRRKDERAREYRVEPLAVECRSAGPLPSDYERRFADGPVGRWYPWFDDKIGTGFTGVAMSLGLMGGGTCEFREDGTGAFEEWQGGTQDFTWRSIGHCRIEVTMIYDWDEEEEDEELPMETSYQFEYARGELQVCLRVTDGGDPFMHAEAPWFLEPGEESIPRQSQPRPLRIR